MASGGSNFNDFPETQLTKVQSSYSLNSIETNHVVCRKFCLLLPQCSYAYEYWLPNDVKICWFL